MTPAPTTVPATTGFKVIDPVIVPTTVKLIDDN